VLLNRADAFTAVSLGVFIGYRSGSTAVDQVANTRFDWYSYPNSTIFNTPSTDALQLKPLFNAGLLNVTINNVQYLQNYSLLRNRRTPITQTALGYGAYSGATGNSGVSSTVVDSFDGTNDGYFPLVPTLQLSGTSKISIQITTPQALPVATAGSGQTCIMVSLRGFLCLGASNLNK